MTDGVAGHKTHRKAATFLISLLLLTPLLVPAQQSGRQGEVESRDRLVGLREGPEGKLSVVLDLQDEASGAPTEIRLLEDGKATVPVARVVALANSDRIVRTAWLVDVSRSMSSAKDPGVAEVQQALFDVFADETMIDRSRSRVALYSFADAVAPEANEFSAPGADVLRQVRALQPRGTKTALYAALDFALDRLGEEAEKGPSDLARAVVITDCKNDAAGGGAGGADPNPEALRDKARALGVSIDVVARVRKDQPIAALSGDASLQTCQKLAADTGGEFAYALPDAAAGLRQVLRAQKRFLVLSFDREVEATAPRTQSVGVSWKRLDGSRGEASIPGAISRTRVASTVSAPADRTPLFFGLLLAVLSGVVLWLVTRSQNVLGESEKSPSADRDLLGTERPDEDRGGQSNPEIGRRTVISRFAPPPPTPDTRWVLVGLEGKLAGVEFPIRGAVSIGADEANEICIPDAPHVSRRHALLSQVGETLILSDQNSRNGTWVGVERTGTEGREIHPGEKIRIADVSFELRWRSRG